MKELREEDVLRLMREEWDAGVQALTEKVDMVMNAVVDGDEKAPVIAPELKVRHKKSQIRYTVSSVGPRDTILRTPEGEHFLVGKDEFEDQYELD
jgi:hypothetical protein